MGDDARRGRHGTPTGSGRLPTFLVIGAMKAGTSSLWLYLAEHPDIYMAPTDAPTKELDFFTDRGHWHRGVEWYRAQFAGAGSCTAVGEASVNYSKHPLHRGVPERAAAVVPEARLVYLIRHPLDRIVSHYRHAMAEWAAPQPLAEAVLDDHPQYLTPCRYAEQLERWLEHFPRDRIHVVTTEDLAHDRAGVVAGVCRFLGVDDVWIPPSLGTTLNAAGTQRFQPRYLRKLRRSRAYEAVRPLVPARVRARLFQRATTVRSDDRIDPTLTPEVRAEILQRLRPDLLRLRELLDGFHCWGLLDEPASTATDRQ